MRGTAIAAASAAVLLYACGVHDVDYRTFVGPVLEVDEEHVCIGGENATGECFVNDERTSDLAIGDCVRVSYRTDVRNPRLSVEEVEVVDPEEHEVCTVN